jgi:quercetin dioxygenase-like cupin family protein
MKNPEPVKPSGDLDDAIALRDLVRPQTGGNVSRQLQKKPAGNVTLFPFDAGQELSEHTSPFDALVLAVDGEAEIAIAGKVQQVRAGQILLLPANVPHGVRATAPFTMMLTMIRA